MGIDPISLGISVALMGINMALTASQKIEGPRLDSLKFTGGDYGNPLPMIWGKRRLSVPVFWAEDLKEVKRRRKTKGGKYNDYTYYGTWAVALAGHEIEGVTRVWFDKHLAYDVTGAGPVTPFDGGDALHRIFAHLLRATGKGNSQYQIYFGTDDQEPDPRMQATVDAKTGLTNSCPAYRGTAYIVFKDIALEKLGNRIPQVDVEIVSTASDILPTEAHTVTYGPAPGYPLTFSSDYSRLGWFEQGGYTSPHGFEIWDTAARSQMLAGAMDTGGGVAGVNDNATFGVYNNGTMLVVGYGSDDIYEVTPEGVTTLVFTASPHFDSQQYGTRVLADGAGVEHWGTYPYSFYQNWYFDGVKYSPGWQACLYFADSYGNIWVVGKPWGATNTCYFQNLVAVDNSPGYLNSFSIAMPVTSSVTINGEGAYAAASGDNFVLNWAGANYLIDPTTGSILSSHTATAAGLAQSAKVSWSNIAPGSDTIWMGNSEYDLFTGELIRTISAIPAGTSGNRSVYDPINHALIVETAPTELTWYYLDRIDSDGVTLGDIEADVAEMCGVLDYDFSAHTQVVDGWSATQGQASNIIEPLHSAYDCTIRPHDFTLQGINYSGTSLGTLTTERFVKADPRYTVKIRQAAELPVAATVSFADINGDQQPNNARADRPLDATGARGEKTIDMGTWATDVDTARSHVDRFFCRWWNERTEVSFALTSQQLVLEPGDCRTINLDDETMIGRLVRLTIKADDTLATEWKYDHPSLAVLDTVNGAAMDGRETSVISVALISKGFVIDGPYLRDADASTPPILYGLAAPYGPGTWPGAVIYQAIDGEYSEEVGSVPSSEKATWGVVDEAFDYTNPNLWDRGTVLTVRMKTGSLTGTTEAAIDANPMANLAAIGQPGRWEYVNFTTATLIAADVYEVSGFKRGRRGTEWAAEQHEAGDSFELLDTAQSMAMGLSEVGTDLSFKAITSGRTESGTFAVPVAPFTGASLKPYAPASLRAAKDSGSGDWTLTWIRRTRVGGAWTSGTSIPLSEASEEYEVEILDGGGSVLHTYTGLTSPTVTYSAADQTSYAGGSVAVGSLHYRIYQISADVDRGFAALADA